MLIANNQAGVIVPGGTPTNPITIPVVSVTQADGNTLKANLSGLTGGLTLGSSLAGADAAGNVLLYAPTVLAQGSSFSHYDTRLTPNAIMEYAINADLQGQMDLDLTPALFQDEGWKLNQGTQQIVGCDTGIPTWVPGGVVIGANVLANVKIIAGAAPTVGDYRTAINAYAASLSSDGLITAGQATSLNSCLSDAETLKQFKMYSAFAPVELTRGMTMPNQAGKAGSSKVYTLDVPVGSIALSLRTLGGSGDVSVYVKVGSAPTASDYTYKSVHAGSNTEVIMLGRPAAGTYYMTVVGETDYSGVTVLGNFTNTAR